jgi:hypothetical protein
MIFDGSSVSPNVRALQAGRAGRLRTIGIDMDFITIFFIAMVLGTIVLAPTFGIENRPEFLRADRKPRGNW